MIAHYHACTICRHSRKWGCTVTRLGFEQVTNAILLCEGKCSEVRPTPTPHRFLEFQDVFYPVAGNATF